MENNNLLLIIDMLIQKIGEQNFDIEQKVKLYQLSNGFLFNEEDVINYIEIGKLIAEEAAIREREQHD